LAKANHYLFYMIKDVGLNGSAVGRRFPRGI